MAGMDTATSDAHRAKLTPTEHRPHNPRTGTDPLLRPFERQNSKRQPTGVDIYRTEQGFAKPASVVQQRYGTVPVIVQVLPYMTLDQLSSSPTNISFSLLCQCSFFSVPSLIAFPFLKDDANLVQSCLVHVHSFPRRMRHCWRKKDNTTVVNQLHRGVLYLHELKQNAHPARSKHLHRYPGYHAFRRISHVLFLRLVLNVRWATPY